MLALACICFLASFVLYTRVQNKELVSVSIGSLSDIRLISRALEKAVVESMCADVGTEHYGAHASRAPTYTCLGALDIQKQLKRLSVRWFVRAPVFFIKVGLVPWDRPGHLLSKNQCTICRLVWCFGGGAQAQEVLAKNRTSFATVVQKLDAATKAMSEVSNETTSRYQEVSCFAFKVPPA